MRGAVVVVVACALLGGCRRSATPDATPAVASAAPSAKPRPAPAVPPGVVIDHSPASTSAYVGSPSIAILPDGSYVASHDWFGSGTTQDHTVVFASHDRGAHWAKLSELDGQWWSTLFVHDGKLHILGTSKQFGHVVIRRSTDGGKTWTTPTDASTGLLSADAGYHCAPTPVVVHGGRIWRAFEDVHSPQFKALVVSAPIDADLLAAKSWTFTKHLPADPDWLDGNLTRWLEGNVVVGPDDRLVDILRVNAGATDEHVALVHIGDPTSVTFDPKQDLVAFPGGSKKFTIRFDPKSKLYWSLANPVPPALRGKRTDTIRNTLALVSSPDLRAWTERAVVLHHPDVRKHGFHYVDWVFDGDDIIAASRTAFDDDAKGAHTYHDANYLTFHRIANFRDAKGGAAEMPPPSSETGDLTITGGDFVIDELEEGARAFSNRKYVWTKVPASLEGLRFTRIRGGEAPSLRVRAKRATTLTIAVGAATPPETLAGWTRSEGSLAYDDDKKSELIVLARSLGAGEEVALPRGTWSGAIVLWKD